MLAKLLLEEEYNYNILLRMTSENPEEIFLLTKDDIPKENTKLRALISPRLQLAVKIDFLSAGELRLWLYGYSHRVMVIVMVMNFVLPTQL